MPLVIAMTATTLLGALAGALVLATAAETTIAQSYREAAVAFYAADGAVEYTLGELAAQTDWNAVLRGDSLAGLTDGPPEGARTVGGTVIDLIQATEDVNAAVGRSSDTPYSLYAYGPFARLVPPGTISPSMYIVVWIIDLSGEQASEEVFSHVIGVAARAYGPSGSRRSIHVRVGRRAPGEALVVLSWHEERGPAT